MMAPTFLNIKLQGKSTDIAIKRDEKDGKEEK